MSRQSKQSKRSEYVHSRPSPSRPRQALSHAGLRTAWRLTRFIVSKRKGVFFSALACMIVSAGVVALNSFYTKYLIDSVITPMLAVAHPSFTPLVRAATVMGGVCVVGVLANFYWSRRMAVMGQDVQKELRDRMFAHLQTLPIRYFDTHAFGDVMSYYTNDIDTLRQMITQSIPQVLISVLTMLCVFVAMCVISLPMTALVLGIFLFNTQVVRVVGGRAGRFFGDQQRELAALNGFVEEAIHGQKVVKVFTHEREQVRDFEQLNEELRAAADKANAFANILMPIIGNVGHLQYVLVATLGAALMLAGHGGVTIGVIGAFLQFGRVFTNNLGQIAQQINFIVMALAGAGRIFDHLDEESEADSGTYRLVNTGEHRWEWVDDETAPTAVLRGGIRLDEVVFGYTANKEVLHGITMYAEPGQKVALIGATGAGKTTITNLINRFYDIDCGAISYDGIDIARIHKPELRRSLGIVLQDTGLFTGSVRDNIRYGRLDATDEEVEAAARLANAHEFIMTLSHGYDTELSGNSEDLSQGQRQLLSIARAALSDPPVMVLDEATSSIDTRTEALVQAGMDALMRGRTVFVIAHRLSTIVNADVIMVMDHGRIIERGNHDQLMAQQGRYWQLYTGVFELE
ncbi:MAG: ABC transporter ATP-binding protein/permease [Actinomycetes bacterium]|nr:ABC transporter ATP-binding protein/permease [Actinomycetes bacterium]